VPGTLAAHEITKSYGAVTVLAGVSLTISPRSRVGVLGPNGIGKSTLLRLLAGLDEPDAGRIVRTPAALAVGYLPQEPKPLPGETLLAYLARRTGVSAAEREMDELAARLGAEPELADAYHDALGRFLALGGGDLAARARGAAAEVGLGGRTLETPLDAMSGGEVARAALAATMLARFDVFLLDEPTNNLDFAGLLRLERFLDQLEAGVAVVSHDRAFLEGVVDRVLELEAETHRPRLYAGGWDEYVRSRARAHEDEESAYARYADERGRFEELLRVRRGQARAAGGMTDRRGTHALSSKVRAAERRLERLDPVSKPWSPWRLQLDLQAGARAGELVARLDGAVVERPGFRLGPISLDLRHRDRLAVVGPNGSGKTTLIAALLGELPLAAGSRTVAPGARIGELDQRRELFDVAQPLIERFAALSGKPVPEARTLLAKFALGADDVLRPAASLSPGERTRAALALLAAAGVNCLVLDEPTNHLDLEAIAQLESAVESFDGAIVLVTHDRRFLEAFGATRTIAL
jgi:ATPase subunit of ABC transporter with duplicated ATPase domains